MKRKIIWSPLALTRINEETEYIARDKPGAAEKWAEGVFESVDRLTDFPESSRALAELGKLLYGS